LCWKRHNVREQYSLSPPNMDTDRNLLFGVFALQADLITAAQFVEACSLWASRKHEALADLLVERGWLAEADRADVERLVQRKLQKHCGDVRASLADLLGDGLRHSLAAVEDVAVRKSLATCAPDAGTKDAAIDGAVPASTTAYEPARRERYTRLHAMGGIGQVWVARDEGLDREVALKELQAERADSPAAVGRFLDEARITGQLEHPGIVPVYELARSPQNGQPFYTMRLIKGRTLSSAIHEYHQRRRSRQAGPLELRELLGAFVAVCNAVAYAHSRGVLHRDLKGSNVVLGDFGEVIVLDWGLAKLLGEAVSGPGGEVPPAPVSNAAEGLREETMQGQVLGTPEYMAPEQAQGRLDLLGPATDVYGLGAILYQVLTGKPPFTGTDTREVLDRVIRQPPIPPRQLVAETPAALEAVCLKALAKKPADRYATAGEIAQEVHRWLADEPLAAYREPRLPRLGRWVRRHKGLVGSAAAMAVVAATVAVAAWRISDASERQAQEQHLRNLAEAERAEAQFQRGRAQEKQQEAEGQRTEAEKQRGRAETQASLVRRHLYFSRISAAQRAWQEGQIVPMTALLEELRPDQPGQEDLRGFEWHYLWSLRDGSQFTIQADTAHTFGVAFSPDGKRLVSYGYDEVLKVWDSITRKQLLQIRKTPEGIHKVVYSPDGRSLITVVQNQDPMPTNDHLVIWDAHSGKAIRTFNRFKNEPYAISVLAVSPDGRFVATGSWDSGSLRYGDLILWEVQNGREARHLKGPDVRGPTSAVTGLAFSPDSKRLASAMVDNTVRLWDVTSGKQISSFSGGNGPLAFHPDGQRLVGVSGLTVRLRRVSNGAEIRAMQGHKGRITDVAFSPDGQLVASSSEDGTVRIWGTDTGRELHTLRGHVAGVTALAFSPDGQRLASAGMGWMPDRAYTRGEVKIWRLPPTQGQVIMKQDVMSINGLGFSVSFSPDGQLLAGLSHEGINVWNFVTGRKLLSVPSPWAPRSGCGDVAFSPDGRALAVGDNTSVTVRDARTGQERFRVDASAGVRKVLFSPNGRQLAAACLDKRVRVWNTATGQEAFRVPWPDNTVFAVGYSPDGKRLAAVIAEGIWASQIVSCNALTGGEVRTVKLHLKTSPAMDPPGTMWTFSPDGKHLASGTQSANIKVWEIDTGREVFRQPGDRWITCVAYSSDGQRLASSGLEGKVRIWDAITGQEALTFRQSETVNMVAFSPDGNRLAGATLSNRAFIWEAGDVKSPLGPVNHEQRAMPKLTRP
jgi:WD40 repeat protein